VFARESFPSLGENVSREAPRQSSRVALDVIVYHCINMNDCDPDSLISHSQYGFSQNQRAKREVGGSGFMSIQA